MTSDASKSKISRSPAPAATRPRYHSRVWVVAAKELKDMVSIAAVVRIAIYTVCAFMTNLQGFAIMYLMAMVELTSPESLNDAKNRQTLEPLLATGAQRRDIVFGKFLAVSLYRASSVFFGVTLLAGLMRVPLLTTVITAMHRTAPTFHLTFWSTVQIIIVIMFGGMEMSAVRLLYSTFRSIKSRMMFWIVGACAGALAIEGSFPALEASMPYLNVMNGVLTVLYQQDGPSVSPWSLTHGWPQIVGEMVVASIMVTVLCLALTIRNLENGGWLEAAGAQPPIKAIGPYKPFAVILVDVGDKKIQVVRIVRDSTRLGLKEAKDLVESAPQYVKEGISKEEAEALQRRLVMAGARVEITPG